MSRIPFSLLKAIDGELLAERERAQLHGAGEWERQLREEAVRTMVATFGASEDDAKHDLDDFLAMSAMSAERTLEMLVYEQRLLARVGEIGVEGG